MNLKKQSEILNFGDDVVFENTYRAYYAPLCFFATKFISSSQDAKDVVEDLFMKLWQKKQRFDSTKHLQAFLYHSCRNACLNFIKHGKVITSAQDILAIEFDSPSDDYLDQMIRTEVWAEIYRAINNLPTQCSRVITMSFIEGYSNDEIAESLQLSVQTVKNHKVRGLNLLKNSLSAQMIALLVAQTLVK